MPTDVDELLREIDRLRRLNDRNRWRFHKMRASRDRLRELNRRNRALARRLQVSRDYWRNEARGWRWKAARKREDVSATASAESS